MNRTIALTVALALSLPALWAGDLGVGVRPKAAGLEVQHVTASSLAAQMGLKPGDVILRVNDKPVRTRDDVTAAIGDQKDVTVEYRPRGQKGAKTLTGLVLWAPPLSEAKDGAYKTHTKMETKVLDVFYPKDRLRPVFILKKK